MGWGWHYPHHHSLWEMWSIMLVSNTDPLNCDIVHSHQDLWPFLSSLPFAFFFLPSWESEVKCLAQSHSLAKLETKSWSSLFFLIYHKTPDWAPFITWGIPEIMVVSLSFVEMRKPLIFALKCQLSSRHEFWGIGREEVKQGPGRWTVLWLRLCIRQFCCPSRPEPGT